MKRKCLHIFLEIVLSVQQLSEYIYLPRACIEKKYIPTYLVLHYSFFCKISSVYTCAISLLIVPGFIARYLVPNCKRSVQLEVKQRNDFQLAT